MKTDTPAQGEELDFVKAYLWLMLAITVAAGGLIWYHKSRVDELRARVSSARNGLADMVVAKQQITAMLGVYASNKEDEARRTPGTWFSRVWQRKGISDQSVRPQTWIERYNQRGNFDESQLEIKIDNKNPLRREQVAQLAHEIEHASTRLRVVELKLRRAGGKDAFEDDAWTGSLSVGYRTARVKE